MATQAVIVTGGKQYLVKPGQTFKVEKLLAEPKTTLSFEPLLVVDGTTAKVGTPKVAGAKVQAEVVGHGLGPKLYVETYRAKTRKHRKIGHRQAFTALKVTAISG